MSYDERYPLKDYLNTINFSKKNLLEDEDPGWEKNYPPFIINKCMSHHMDTVMFANEMNQYPGLDKKLQYDFFINIVRPRKRFSPWGKKRKGERSRVCQAILRLLYRKSIASIADSISYSTYVIKTKLNKGGKKR